MKRTLALLVGLVLIASTAMLAQTAPTDSPAAAQAAKPAASGGGDLESVLNKMDQTAAAFKTLEAGFVWDQYSKVVDEHDLQKGTIYFRRSQKGLEMMAQITDPSAKSVLFSEGKVRVFEPRIDQVTEYNAGKNKAEFESFLVLGFGGRGHDLEKSFAVKYAGSENLGGTPTAKLELTPKSPKVRNMFATIVLWIDLARGISVQQQFNEPSGDYRLAKYSKIKANQHISDDVFKLKTTPSTKVVRPQA